MFRGLFLFILEFFLFGINLYGWKSIGINHVHICDLDPNRKHISSLEVMEASVWSVWFQFGLTVVAFVRCKTVAS